MAKKHISQAMKEYTRYILEDGDGTEVGVPYEEYEYGKARERALKEGLRIRTYIYDLADHHIGDDWTPKPPRDTLVDEGIVPSSFTFPTQ